MPDVVVVAECVGAAFDDRVLFCFGGELDHTEKMRNHIPNHLESTQITSDHLLKL